MKNIHVVFLIFIFFVKLNCFCNEIYDIEYYNLELKSLENYKMELDVVKNKTNKKDVVLLKTYFEELYLYYSEFNRVMDDLTIYKKQILKNMNMPDGIDGNVFWNKKEKKLDFYLSYKIKVYIDIEKMIKGDDLNE